MTFPRRRIDDKWELEGLIFKIFGLYYYLSFEVGFILSNNNIAHDSLIMLFSWEPEIVWNKFEIKFLSTDWDDLDLI